MSPHIYLISTLLLAFGLTSCSATGYSIVDLADEINATRCTAPIVITAGDTVRITFPFRADWNHQARVRDDGSAAFLLVDNMKVAGLSLQQLDKQLTKRYAVLRDNQETIELTFDVQDDGGAAPGAAATASGTQAYVIGEVQAPGPIPLLGRPMTLFDAIAASGGHMKETANLRNTILIRRISGSNQMRSWRLDAGIYNWGKLPPIWLQDRDIVFIPNTAIDDADIWVDQYIRRLIPLPYISQGL